MLNYPKAVNSIIKGLEFAAETVTRVTYTILFCDSPHVDQFNHRWTERC
jgi:hypothetical protein